jgi:glycosyltransferase involved in cell wall biosynthesis
VVGPSVNIDLFRPRPTETPVWPDRPLRVAAMIRPSTHYRQPRLTLEVLKSVIEDSKSEMDIILFGVDPDDPEFLELPLDFPWKTAGMINQYQVARLMNETDIFTDFSYHQAMGLTAMEAMACGAAVIVPEFGGATSFVLHGQNGWVVNTNSFENCKDGLIRLMDDHQLRSQIQDKALQTICSFYPEKATYEILSIIFNSAGE